MTTFCRECGAAHERNSDFCCPEHAASFKKRSRAAKGKCRLCGRGFKGKVAIPKECLDFRLADGLTLREWLRKRRLEAFEARRAAKGNGSPLVAVPSEHNVSAEMA